MDKEQTGTGKPKICHGNGKKRQNKMGANETTNKGLKS
jgi:hypothetical protein